MPKLYVIGNGGTNQRGRRQSVNRDEFGDLIREAMEPPKIVTQTTECRVMESGYCLRCLEHHFWRW